MPGRYGEHFDQLPLLVAYAQPPLVPGLVGFRPAPTILGGDCINSAVSGDRHGRRGPPSTSLLITAGKDVDADPGLRWGRLCVGMTIPLLAEGHRKWRLVSGTLPDGPARIESQPRRHSDAGMRDRSGAGTAGLNGQRSPVILSHSRTNWVCVLRNASQSVGASTLNSVIGMPPAGGGTSARGE